MFVIMEVLSVRIDREFEIWNNNTKRYKLPTVKVLVFN